MSPDMYISLLRENRLVQIMTASSNRIEDARPSSPCLSFLRMSNVVNKLDNAMEKNCQTHFIRQVKCFTLVAFTFIIIKYLTHVYSQESQVTCPCSPCSSPQYLFSLLDLLILACLLCVLVLNSRLRVGCHRSTQRVCTAYTRRNLEGVT